MMKWLFGGKESKDPPRRNPEIELPFEGEIVTDTASIVIFDMAALKHRFDDDCDWWADPKEELEELGARNVLIVGLGSDGFYDITVTDRLETTAPAYSLKVPSGRIFLGPGEEITGGENEPDGQWGGYFLTVAPGDYSVTLTRVDSQVNVGIVKSEPFENAAKRPVTV